MVHLFRHWNGEPGATMASKPHDEVIDLTDDGGAWGLYFTSSKFDVVGFLFL